MELQDMSHTSEDIKNISTAEMSKPEYPYGLQITLSPKELEKLPVMKAPEVGKMFNILACAEVIEVSKAEKQDQSEGFNVRLQIKELELKDKEKAEQDPKEKATEQVIYGE